MTGNFEVIPPNAQQGGVYRIVHRPSKDVFLVDWVEVGTYRIVTQWLKAHRGMNDPQVDMFVSLLFPAIRGILMDMELLEIRYAMLESVKVPEGHTLGPPFTWGPAGVAISGVTQNPQGNPPWKQTP